ncbi:unnamed protein product, partial [Hapterophycus canaliculatus]
GGDGGRGAGNGYGKSEQQQRGAIMPWQHEMMTVNGYSPSPSSHHQQGGGGGGSEPSAENLSAVGIASMQNGGSSISNNDGGGRGGGANHHGSLGGGGTDPGDGGSVEFDPQADCRPPMMGSHHHHGHHGHHGQASGSGSGNGTAAVGGSPASWWREPPEPVVSTFPWDLQLPNPAPPLALSSHTTAGNSGGGLHQETMLGEFGGGRRGGGSGGGGGPPASVMGGSTGVSTLRGSGGGSNEHPSLCRFGKPSTSSLIGLGPAPDIVGDHRHRGAAGVDHHLHPSSSPLDILDNDGGGNGGGSVRTGGSSSTMLLDAVGRRPYGSSGGPRWASNSAPPSATEVSWGIGGSRSGGGGGGGGGGAGTFLTSRKLEETRRGTAPSCDTLVPPPSHAPTYDVVSLNSRSLLGIGGGSSGGGGGSASDRFMTHDFKSLTMASTGDPDGFMFGGGGGNNGVDPSCDMSRIKRARVMKREDDGMHLSLPSSAAGIGLSDAEAVFGRLMGRDRASGSRGGDGVGGGARSRGVMGEGGHGGHASLHEVAGSWGGGGSGGGRGG